jgi:hypothetical protein
MNIKKILSHSGPVVARASSTYGVCEGLRLGVEKRPDWSYKKENIIRIRKAKTSTPKVDLYGLI